MPPPPGEKDHAGPLHDEFMWGLGPGLLRWQNLGQDIGSNLGRGSNLEPWLTLEHNPRSYLGFCSEVGRGSRFELRPGFVARVVPTLERAAQPPLHARIHGGGLGLR